MIGKPFERAPVEGPADDDHRGEDEAEKHGEKTVRPVRPDEDGVGHVAERLVHRDDDRADDACRKPHIVKAEAHMRPKEVGRRGWKDEADPNAGRKRERNADNWREVG